MDERQWMRQHERACEQFAPIKLRVTAVGCSAAALRQHTKCSTPLPMPAANAQVQPAAALWEQCGMHLRLIICTSPMMAWHMRSSSTGSRVSPANCLQLSSTSTSMLKVIPAYTAQEHLESTALAVIVWNLSSLWQRQSERVRDNEEISMQGTKKPSPRI